MGGGCREGSFTGDPERYVKEIHKARCRSPLQAGIFLHRGPVREPGGDSLAGTF